MGHDKLRKFAENETFACLLQPSASEALADGFFSLRDHRIKGHWGEEMFGNDHPLVLELGCGKGEYTLELARRNPSVNYIGVDIKGARLWRGAKTATEEGLKNVAFLRARIEFITAYFAPGEVSQIWLTFSDPQFKSENSRLTSPLFLERYRSFMKPDGVVHLKTDSRYLYHYTCAVAFRNGLEILDRTDDLYARPHREGSVLYEVQTFYEKMFLEQGYKINYLCFGISHEGPFLHPEDCDTSSFGPREAALEKGVFDSVYWRSVEGPRLLFGHDSAETRRQKISGK